MSDKRTYKKVIKKKIIMNPDKPQTIEEVKTAMGTFSLYDNGFCSLEPSKDWKFALWRIVKGEVFEKDDKKGVSLNGDILVPAHYDDIGIVHNPDRLYLVRKGRFDLYQDNGYRCTGDYYESDSHFIFKDGKMGWERDDKVVVEPKYDDVSPWGFGVYETRNGSDIKYLKEDGTEVLTFRRRIDEEFDSPFWWRSDEGDAFTIFECPPKLDLPKSNVLEFTDGTEVGVDRFNRDVILKELVNPADELPLTKNKIEGLTNEFSYEFSAYRFTVKGERPLKQVTELIKKFGADDNTWYYVIRLTTPSGEYINAKDLLGLSKFLDTNRNKALGKSIGIGHDDALNPGEVSAFIITHYNECCFPPSEHFEWLNACKTGTLDEVKEAERSLIEFVRNDVVDECQDDFLKDNYESAIWNIAVDFKHSRNWEETEKVLDFLAVKTDSFQDQVWRIIKEIISDDPYVDRPFLVDYLSWILRKGAKINGVKAGQTPLDFVNEKIKTGGQGTDEVLYKIRDILKQHGALTYRGLRNKFLKDHTEYEFALHVLANRN